MKNIINILTLVVLFVMTSCQPSGESETQSKLSGELYMKYGKWDLNKDSILDDYERAMYAEDVTDSMINQSKENLYIKLAKNAEENSKVEIIKVSITHNEYSTKWDNIKVTFKNNSNKTIKAIRFRWYDIKNSFDEQLDIHYGGGDMEENVGPNQKTSGEWETYEDRITSAKAYVSKIIYTDGTTWDNNIQ